MNEAHLMFFLKNFYEALTVLDDIRLELTELYQSDKIDYDTYQYIIDTYDELFDKTTEIEEYFGLLD